LLNSSFLKGFQNLPLKKGNLARERKENNKESPSHLAPILIERKRILTCSEQINRGIYTNMQPPLGFHVRYGIFVQYRDTIIPLQFSLVTAYHEPKLS
jgi:hypothetical protein